MSLVADAYAKYSLNVEIVKIREAGTINTCSGIPSNSCSKSDINVAFLGINDGCCGFKPNAKGQTTARGL